MPSPDRRLFDSLTRRNQRYAHFPYAKQLIELWFNVTQLVQRANSNGYFQKATAR
jgi:hypothetical protein